MPASPATAAPRAKAWTLNRNTGLPATAATISSSRIARSTRPNGERRAPDGQQGGRVRADAEEGDGAEVHESGQSPLDVQAEGEQGAHADQRRDGGEVGNHPRALTIGRRPGRSAAPAARRG